MTARILAALLLASVSTPGAARDRNAVPAATPVGKPLTCVPIRSLRESLVRSDRVIDFRGSRGLFYRVTLPRACPGLGFERRFSYATSLSQLCAQDIITVLYQSPVMPGASCGLAPFQPVRLPKR
ncbi:hypothetical protein [Sphingomonas corticis]|jgi:hypothetical protein|uniref:Uncharacterized protein n=1 Tax=Sphingomonas corticis TaxID=2722791 RepID=A0ABX1CKW0_9SPHN|nr:hypothetical protein [Sphingomonas corticis]NJR78629.1 hypothetical protein [Sphingomonas corticis]